MPETQGKQNNFERTKELTDRLEAGMKDLFQSDKFKNYLKTMSHFHHYSTRNVMLINMQRPGATRVASYGLWKEKFNRQVKKGETGIRIFAPIKDNEPEKKTIEKLDPETGAPLLDDKGNVIKEEMTALTNGIRFKLVPVFDVSQTFGDPLPELVENLTGNVDHYAAFVDALKRVSPLPVVFEPMQENQDGYCHFGEKIGIREGMSEIQTVSAVVHEITHARLHDKNTLTKDTKPKSKIVREVEAEATAYVVAQHFNIETSPNSFGYLAEYGSRDMSELKASLDTIRKEASQLINAIEDRFSIICKERDITLPAKLVKEAEKEPAKELVEKPLKELVEGLGKELGKESEIYQFATDYISHITDIYNTSKNMGQKEREHAINGIADIMQKGQLDGIREALDRSSRNSTFSVQSEALSERLNMMFPQISEQMNEAAKALPSLKPDETMPDPDVSIAEMNMYGYQYEGMLPLSHEKAMELYDKDHPIYLLHSDNTEAMVFERSEIVTFDGIFGIDRGEWERTVEYKALSAKNSEAAKEADIINSNTDMFGIYQLKYTEELRYHRFASLKQLQADHLAVDRSNYELVYTAPLPPKGTLDDIYQQFNIDQPKDFTGHCLSPSDVIVIQQAGVVTSHYVDNFGFAELPCFMENERQLEKADKAVTSMTDTKNQSVYMQSTEHARVNGELEMYRESIRLNKECAGAIDAAIKDCIAESGRGYRLTPEAVSQVADIYGEQRMNVVLANTVRLADWDGRYSKDTKDWAKGVEMPEVPNRHYYSTSHPAVVDGYIRLARKDTDSRNKKPSILDALKQGAEKSLQQDKNNEISKKPKRMEI